MMYTQKSIDKVLSIAAAVRNRLDKVNAEDIQICISEGNRKIGRVLNVSLMPVVTCHNCSECKFYCYDIKACLQYPTTVIDARMRNTVLLERDRDRFFDLIEKKIAGRRTNKYFRWHVAGDIPDIDYFSRMVEIARRHTDFIFWTYTKHYGIVNRWIDVNGELPANLHVMFSEWDGMPLINPHNLPIFSCKLKAGNKNHEPEFFNTLYRCPGNCDLCKKGHAGCIGGMSTYADEH